MSKIKGDINREMLGYAEKNTGDCYGDGTVYRGERSADSAVKTYTLQELAYAKGVPVKEVPIPHKPLKRKGQTKYDKQFEKMLQGKTAIEIHEDNFQAMRRALMRFREYRNLNGKLTIRQDMNSETRMVTLWFEMKGKEK